MTPRRSIRVLLFNSENEILLLRAEDPTTTTVDGSYRGPFWFPVGGEIESGESIEEAARREVFEETGITEVKLGPLVWFGTFDLVLSGKPTRLFQEFIVGRTEQRETTLAHLTEAEKRVLTHARWFSLDEMGAYEEMIYPAILKTDLADIAAGNYPDEPIEVELGDD